jgi:Na+/H+ antiporter NhaD/arsenite permease-like protein
MLSTLAGNLLLTGSICNIIVAEIAAAHGLRLSFADFARSGIVITLPAMAATAAWIYVLGLMPL